MLVLEALRARFGDALMLHSGTKARPRLTVIDGGPAGVYNDAVKPRLERLRAERKLASTTPLGIDLAMVSHIDDDHVAGLLDLTRALNEAREAGDPRPWKIARFWHNSFDDLLDNDDLAVASAASMMSTASLGGEIEAPGAAILASVKQGRELRDLLAAMSLAGNKPVGGLVLAGGKNARVTVGDLAITVVGPSKESLIALREKWDKEIKPLVKAGKAGSRAEIAAYVDNSVHNLSSIVVLVESQGKRLLFTGDGRGDHTLAGLKAAGLLKNGKLALDVLKLPHHGSSRNVDADYFRTIVAEHYVISADGKYDNPDVDTLKMLSVARKDDRFTIHLTYDPKDFEVKAIGREVAQFFAAERKAGRTYTVNARPAGELALRLPLV